MATSPITGTSSLGFAVSPKRRLHPWLPNRPPREERKAPSVKSRSDCRIVGIATSVIINRSALAFIIGKINSVKGTELKLWSFPGRNSAYQST